MINANELEMPRLGTSEGVAVNSLTSLLHFDAKLMTRISDKSVHGTEVLVLKIHRPSGSFMIGGR
jgi:hypothetical protein